MSSEHVTGSSLIEAKYILELDDIDNICPATFGVSNSHPVLDSPSAQSY
jgi:hypothetical protein